VDPVRSFFLKLLFIDVCYFESVYLIFLFVS
jgi:hypothetical protein